MKNKKQRLAALTLLALLCALTGCNTSSSSSKPGASSAPPPPAESEGQPTGNPGGLTGLIAQSYSASEFVAEPVEDNLVEAVLQSGVRAPSAKNEQRWHFTVVKKPDTVAQLANHAKDGSVAIIVCGPENDESATFDCALAVQNMYLEAQALGLGAHMYGSSLALINNDLRTQLAIPDQYEAKIVLLIGHVDAQVDAVASASARNPLNDSVNYVE